MMPSPVEEPKKPKSNRRNGLYYFDTFPEGILFDKNKGLPSVTTILGDTIAKPGLITWAAKLASRAALQDPSITEEQATSAIYEAKKEGGSRGGLVHSLTEAADNGHLADIETLPPHIRPYALAHQKFIKDFQPKLIKNEMVVANFTFGYAGQLDRIYDIREDMDIVDFKTSPRYYKENGLQLSAYKHAEFVYDKINKVWSPMPKVHRTLVVLLGEDGTYTVKETDEPLEIFLALKKVYLWLNKEKLEKVKINKNARPKKKKGEINEPTD